MAESLLTLTQLLGVLHIDRATFYRKEATLKAAGLQETRIGTRRLFRQASVDRMIRLACDGERPIC